MIKLSEVTMQYPKSTRPALSELTMEIDKGEFAFLIGPSGSGKSTFFRLLLKEDRPTSGEVWVGDFHVNTLRGRQVPKLRQSIGCVFQDFRLLEKKNVADNVAFALQVIGKPASTIRQAVPEVLDYVGLSGKADRMPRELSGGEKQRVAIARAIVNRPAVLLADEPTGNLDPQTSEEIVEVIDRVNRRGTTVVMATHDRHIVDSMRRRVLEFDNGELVRNDETGVYGIG
ncbi:MAG: cell division ATP-binding protein FtsE [Gordonia sp. (in: high G+C Gram-positive bacteria)]|uniref:cell division ATP-binding protein FtsE n=1 Tax=Gordonia sp. (in: high G+C Gram-positive bacteria) TaxID=84139 RepID=UPI003BB61BD5